MDLEKRKLQNKSGSAVGDVVEKHAAIDVLGAGRHVQGRVAVEEAHGAQADAQRLAGHDGETLEAGHVVEAELHLHDGVAGGEAVSAGGPGAHAVGAAALVGV